MGRQQSREWGVLITRCVHCGWSLSTSLHQLVSETWVLDLVLQWECATGLHLIQAAVETVTGRALLCTFYDWNIVASATTYHSTCGQVRDIGIPGGKAAES